MGIPKLESSVSINPLEAQRQSPFHGKTVAAMVQELTARFGDRPGNADRPMPMLHNFVITIEGDEATGICSNELRATEDGQSIIASGYYEDRYRREGGLWKFARRDTSFFHWVPLEQGWA